MAPVRLSTLRKDQRGAAIMEFSIVAGTMITLLFGIVEFSNLFSQWNAATKAVQVGARLAATGAPLWSTITSLTGAEDSNATPGQAITYEYRVRCTSSGCDIISETIPGGALSSAYDATAMDNLVFGRGSIACNDPPGTYFGMCDIFKRVTINNVEVEYQHTKTGYTTRPGGLVPTITVRIIGLNFQFIFLDDIMGIFGNGDLNQVPIPGLVTTMIAEDMRAGAPTF